MRADTAVHLPPILILLIAGVAILAAISRAVERRARARRAEARRERQREYRRYLRTDGWKERRQVALDRAGGFCEDCGTRDSLEVHHRTYVRKGAERPEDLVAVCGDCHDERHRGKRTLIDWMALAFLRRWRIWRYKSAETSSM
jgi:5-methylcytosine-specific restriction endonuclease McrA